MASSSPRGNTAAGDEHIRAFFGKRQGSGFADARGTSGNKNSLVFEDFHNWGPMAFLACQCLEQGLALVLETGQIRRLADGAFGIG